MGLFLPAKRSVKRSLTLVAFHLYLVPVFAISRDAALPPVRGRALKAASRQGVQGTLGMTTVFSVGDSSINQVELPPWECLRHNLIDCRTCVVTVRVLLSLVEVSTVRLLGLSFIYHWSLRQMISLTGRWHVRQHAG